MMPSAIWLAVFGRILAVVALALAAGLIFGYPLLWILGALSGLLTWHLYNAIRLEAWLRARKGKRPRRAAGVWGDIYAHLYRIRRQNRQRKKRLTRLLKEFRKSTAAMPDGGVVLNPSNEITWMNSAARALLGFGKADRGQRVDNLIREPRFLKYLRSGSGDGPVRIAAPNAPDRLLSVQIIPYGDNQRLLLAKDITRETRLEKVRRDFVGNASHELRSPLTVITGYLDALAEDPALPGTWNDPVVEMVAQGERMQAIIEDLLTLSRLEAAEPEAGREVVDVAGMLAMIRKEALAMAPRPEQVELEIESDSTLLGCGPEIYSAASNLVSNAVKYTPPEGSVTIRWTTDEDGGHLSVIDTGMGVPDELIPRLTERFYRVDKGRDRDKGGTGLGLAIVKHILQRHDACLEVQSKLGLGSTFVCHFPRSRLAR